MSKKLTLTPSPNLSRRINRLARSERCTDEQMALRLIERALKRMPEPDELLMTSGDGLVIASASEPVLGDDVSPQDVHKQVSGLAKSEAARPHGPSAPSSPQTTDSEEDRT